MQQAGPWIGGTFPDLMEDSNFKGDPILVDEVRDAIRRLLREKAAGFDDLPAELIKFIFLENRSIITH